MKGCNDSLEMMKRFICGLIGFVVVWIVGLAPQFLAYAIAIRSREIVPFMPNRNRKFAAAISWWSRRRQRTLTKFARARINAASIWSAIALPFGRLWYDTPDHAFGYAMHSSRSHDAVIRVYDAASDVIETLYSFDQ